MKCPFGLESDGTIYIPFFLAVSYLCCYYKCYPVLLQKVMLILFTGSLHFLYLEGIDAACKDH
jgi:hypothetical protein